MNKEPTFSKGFKDGLPIGLGYLSVSFSFGIMAITAGLSWWQAVLVSITNLTSAGQVAGIGIMSASGGLIEMMVSQFIINIRYSLMAVSLSQKTDSSMNTLARLICGYSITDEIFGVASGEPHQTSKSYFMGLSVLPVIGWTLGTLLGAVLGNIFPEVITNSLAIGIYGMFVCIVLPKAKKDKIIMVISLISCAISALIYYVPALHAKISSGFAIIISAVIAALIGVMMFKPETTEET